MSLFHFIQYRRTQLAVSIFNPYVIFFFLSFYCHKSFFYVVAFFFLFLELFLCVSLHLFIVEILLSVILRSFSLVKSLFRAQHYFLLPVFPSRWDPLLLESLSGILRRNCLTECENFVS